MELSNIVVGKLDALVLDSRFNTTEVSKPRLD